MTRTPQQSQHCWGSFMYNEQRDTLRRDLLTPKLETLNFNP